MKVTTKLVIKQKIKDTGTYNVMFLGFCKKRFFLIVVPRLDHRERTVDQRLWLIFFTFDEFWFCIEGQKTHRRTSGNFSPSYCPMKLGPSQNLTFVTVHSSFSFNSHPTKASTGLLPQPSLCVSAMFVYFWEQK